MKIAYISDTHSPLFIRNFRYKNILEKSTDYFLELCEKHKVEKVYHLGDMVHVKENISLDSLIFTYEQFRKIYTKYETYCIPGNHDMISKKDTTLNFTKIFSDSVTVVDTKQEFSYPDFSIWLLGYDSADKIIDRINKIDLNKKKKNFLFGHFGVNGFSYQEDGYTDNQSSITKKLLSKFDRVFLGHFHSHQTQDNITYVSSPYQQRFGDDGGHYGFTFYDTKKDEIIFEPNINTPRFVQMDLTKENLLIANKLRDCFIRFNLNKTLNNQTQFKIKLAIEKNNFEVSWKSNIQRQDTKIVKLENWDNLVSKDADQIIVEAVETLDETKDTKEAIKGIILDAKKNKK